MLELQDRVNSKIRSDWRNANNAWFRAVWTECAELVDHIGWKWWKHQSPDIPQVHLELVDIFHFGLSELLQQHGTAQEAASHLTETYVAYGSRGGAGVDDSSARIALVEAFASAVLMTRRFDLKKFCELASAVGLQEEALYEMYVGKNVLNGFRQDHGYKAGSYLKIWDGREDNVWLVEFAAGLDKHPATFASELYNQLSKKYDEVARGR
ncbi:dUTP diphosphatase [Variovorax paradoxus]|uniref:dUTP diphosphatase n=1 Tax=Variovorax paradoxus TaxID=34073 RepID=UPI003ECEAD13